MKTLHPHQTKALRLLRQSIASGYRRPMVQSPTGSGKTVLSANIVRGALGKNRRVTFTVPAIELIDQTARSFWEEKIRDVGVIQADHPMTDGTKPVQIASVQTLESRGVPDTDVVIVDEAHRHFAVIQRWMEERPELIFIGLSATPWSKGLGRWYDRLIIAATTKELIEAGLLSPFRTFAPSHPDLRGVRTVAGDYHEGQLSEAMQKGQLTADIVSTWLAKGENRPTLCFAVDRAHAAKIQQEFLSAGVSCGYVDAHTPKVDRERLRQQFASGEVKVVCNVGVLTTGVDWDVRCLILARPTKSEILFVQIIGRGLRTADGKSECLILDHSDTTLRLGLVTDIHHETLHDGSPADKANPSDIPAAKPKECPKCSFVIPPKTPICPNCGFKRERKSDVEVQEGELIELDAYRKAKQPSLAEQVRFMGELRTYAVEKGKTEGWSAALWRAKYGDWPNAPEVRAAQPVEVSVATRGWIKHRAIAYAKRKAKG